MTSPHEQDGFASVARGTNEKVPALWNEDAERAVLSALMLDPKAATAVAPILSEASFYREGHRRLFRAMRTLRAADTTVDPITLRHALEADGSLKAVGGDLAIAQLYDEIPTTENVTHHAAIVRGFARRRELLALSKQLASEAVDQEIPIEQAFDHAGERLLQASTPAADKSFRHIKAGVFATLERIEARRDGKESAGLATGWPELDDRMAGGPEAGTLVVVVGVPSSGKTSLVWNLLTNTALDGRGATAMVSAEMTEAMLLESQLSSLSGVPRERLKKGDLTEDDMQRVTRAAVRSVAAPIYISDQQMPDVEDVVNQCILLKAQHPTLCAIGVDFIQLLQLRSKERGELQADMIRRIAYALKGVALKLGVVIYALAQPNDKQIEDREDKRPQLRDIQGSSGIRQAADVIMLLYRPGQYSASAGPELEVNLGKNKFGPIGLAMLEWEGAYVRVNSKRRRQYEAELEASRRRPLTLEVT